MAGIILIPVFGYGMSSGFVTGALSGVIFRNNTDVLSYLCGGSMIGVLTGIAIFSFFELIPFVRKNFDFLLIRAVVGVALVSFFGSTLFGISSMMALRGFLRFFLS
jgi:hypothetical protein